MTLVCRFHELAYGCDMQIVESLFRNIPCDFFERIYHYLFEVDRILFRTVFPLCLVIFCDVNECLLPFPSKNFRRRFRKCFWLFGFLAQRAGFLPYFFLIVCVEQSVCVDSVELLEIFSLKVTSDLCECFDYDFWVGLPNTFFADVFQVCVQVLPEYFCPTCVLVNLLPFSLWVVFLFLALEFLVIKFQTSEFPDLV